MNALNIKFSWQTVRTDASTGYQYPNPRTAFMRKEYSRPGVYRWARCLPNGRLEPLYVGETENLYKRLGDYLKPSTQTEHKQALGDEKRQGFHVRFELLEFEPFEINGLEFQPRETLIKFSAFHSYSG